MTLYNKVYLIGVAYCPPNTNIELFINDVNEILEPLKNKYHIILMGDFNICFMKDSNSKNAFQNTMQTNSLFPIIMEPTRVNLVNREGQNIVTESLIDNIFVNENLTYNS
ncbi:unnamed protein product, partial [Meganyctiphanes norvegica]